jgi:hypothetical protein
MNMRDQIAEILRGGRLQHIEEDVMADAILEALPDMIAPLVWIVGKDGRGFGARSVLGQYGIFDEGNPRWYSPTRGGPVYRYTETFEEAEAAANTHNRAAGMAIFTGETV